MKIIYPKTENELYKKYPSQDRPQPCFVLIDCIDKTLSVRYDPEVGYAIPIMVWMGHIRRIDIPVLTNDAAKYFLDKIAPIAAKIIDGYSSDWDGGNYVASYTDGANEAFAKLEEDCYNNAFWELSIDVVDEEEEDEE